MSQPDRGPVVIDTSVYSARFGPRRGHRLASAYEGVLEGRTEIISFVTVAEMRFGARIAEATRTMKRIVGSPLPRSALESRLSRTTRSSRTRRTFA